MPKGVVKTKKDEKIWNYKKKQVEKQTGKKASQFTDNDWRRVNFLYQKAKKKYKGKLPNKYVKASFAFKEAILSKYVLVTAASELESLHTELMTAKQQIDLLCKGFNVHLDPAYGDIINKVVSKIDYWEKTDRLVEIQKDFPVVHFSYIHASQDEKGNTLSPKIFKQFHDKFLHIVTTIVIPALKKYVKQNPTIKTKLFRPLLNVTIK